MKLLDYLFKCSILITILFFSKTNCEAQIQVKDLSYSISYLGNNLWNPGFKLGAIAPKTSQIKSNKKEKKRTIQTNYIGSLGFYHDQNSHSGVFVHAGWQRKKIYSNRFFIAWEGKPLGIYRSFLPETYKVAEDGSVTKVSIPGRFYLAPSASAGIGFVDRLNPNQGLFAKVNMMLLLPYNTYVMPLLNVEFGYQFTLQKSKK